MRRSARRLIGQRLAGLRFEPASAIRPEAVRWLWDLRIPLGTLTLLAGRQGLGKSTLATELAARASRGELDGDLRGQPVGVLLVSFEDHAPSKIVPRLMAANADLERVRLVSVAQQDGDLVTLPSDLGEIERAAHEHGARLLVVDPVVASLPAAIDAHRDQDVRRALAPLGQLAERCDLAALGLIHWNKASGADALMRVSGSTAFTAAARSVLAFGTDPSDGDSDDESSRVLAHAKSNLGRCAPSLACRIEGREVDLDDGSMIATSRLVILGACDVRAHELFSVRHPDERSKLEEAIEFLTDELCAGEWRPKPELDAAAAAAGVAARTLARARKRLGVEVRREGFPSITQWRLAVVPSTAGTTGTPDVGTTAKPL